MKTRPNIKMIKNVNPSQKNIIDTSLSSWCSLCEFYRKIHLFWNLYRKGVIITLTT